MKLIVGLGNPGSRYSDTRHNAGRLLVEFAARRLSAKFKSQKKLKASTALVSFGTEEALLAFPEIYMNTSGEAVGLLIREFGIQPSSELLITLDEAALPFGKFRLRSKGSDGGHNGLKSIAGEIGTTAYPRLRFGIGPEMPSELPLEVYVLEKFSKSEIQALPEILEKGYRALELWVTQPIERAMNAVNS